jgi:hypothetical protein
MRLIDRKKPINQHDIFYYLDYRWIGRCKLDANAEPLLVNNKRRHEYLFTSPVTVIDSRNRFGEILGVGLPTNFFVSDKMKLQMDNLRLSGLEF